MSKLIDRYILGARVAPVAVVSFSLFLAISAWIPFSKWPIKLAGGSTVLVLAAFVLAQIARDVGKAIEGPLWASWGGPPTVRMLRHRDTTFDPGLKARIHRRLVDLRVVDHMPSEAEEEADPAGADKVYTTCSGWLRNKALELKAVSPFDVVHAENIAYGFRRNILGIRPYGLTILGIAVAATVAAFLFDREPIVELCGITMVGAFLALGVNKGAMQRAANEYSIRLLNAVEAIPLPKASVPKAGSGTSRKSSLAR